MWTIDKAERRFISNNQEKSNMGYSQGEQSEDVNDNPSSNHERRDSTKDKYSKGHIVIPYTQEVVESIKIYAKGMVFRPTSVGIVLLRIHWSYPRTKIL